MGETWDKIKNKGAEIKGEIKNEYKNVKEDLSGKDHSGDAAYNRGVDKAMSGNTPSVDHDTRNAVKDTAIPRNTDGSVDTKTAEMKGQIKNEMKHQDKEEKKGYDDARKDRM